MALGLSGHLNSLSYMNLHDYLCKVRTLLHSVMTTSETSVNVITNSPSQDYTHPDNHNLPTYDMTPGARSSKVPIPFRARKSYFMSAKFTLKIQILLVFKA